MATLLLIVIAVAAISVTYAWIMTYMGDTQSKAGLMLSQANTNFNATGIFVDVQNIGNSAGQISAVYIGLSETSQTRVTTSQTLPVTVNPNQIQTLTVPMANYPWTTGNTYYIKVVPSTGAALSFTAKP